MSLKSHLFVMNVAADLITVPSSIIYGLKVRKRMLPAPAESIVCCFTFPERWTYPVNVRDEEEVYESNFGAS